MSTPAGTAARPRATTLWLLGIGLALGTALRVRESLRTPLWFDEIYILSVARQSILDVVHTVARDIHPPLQFLARWAWIRIGGDGEQWTRSLSILFSLLALVWTWRLGRRLFGDFPALFAVLVLAVHGTHIRYSQEVEDYSLTWLTLLGAVDAAWRWIEERRARHALAFWIWGVLALYTHYLSLFVLAALLLWGLVALARDRAALVSWLGLYAGLLVGFLPQGLVFLEQFRREGSAAYFHYPGPAALYDLWRRMCFGASYLMAPLIVASLVPLLARGRRRAASLLCVLCTLPLLSTRLWVVILPREALYILPLWWLLVGAGLERLPGRRTAGIAAAVLFVFALRALAIHPAFSEAVALRRVEDFVRARAGAADRVIHAESHSLLFFRYHFPGARNLLLIRAGDRVPYFEGGLAIPESLYYTPARWAGDRAAGARWWGVRVNRAFVTRGQVSRAGAAGDAAMRAASDSVWDFTPVTLYRGH